MAITRTVSKYAVSLKLNDGTTSTGAMKTVSLSLGSLDKTRYEADTSHAKAMGLVALLEPVLSKAVVGVIETTTASLVDND